MFDILPEYLQLSMLNHAADFCKKLNNDQLIQRFNEYYLKYKEPYPLYTLELKRRKLLHSVNDLCKGKTQDVEGFFQGMITSKKQNS